MKKTMGIFTAVILLGLSLAVSFNAKANDEPNNDAAITQEKTQKKGGSEPHPGMGHMMGGKMDMNQMSGMMHECMTTHNDGKMCGKDMMTKCQEHMGENECQKMMKKMKAGKKK